MLGIPRAGLRRPAAVLVAAATLTALTTTTSGAQAAPSAPTETYLVQTADAPVATYNGGVARHRRDPAGDRPQDRHPGRQRPGVPRPPRRPPQRRAAPRRRVGRQEGVRLHAGLRRVQRGADRQRGGAPAPHAGRRERLEEHACTPRRPSPRPSSSASTAGAGRGASSSADPRRAGEGVIVGVIDSGFWPENPSFGAAARRRAATRRSSTPSGAGTCDAGVEAPGRLQQQGDRRPLVQRRRPVDANPGEFDSPRDYYGHGSHTASTAAGNHGVTATIKRRRSPACISGMAPAARLSIYKVLYANAARHPVGRHPRRHRRRDRRRGRRRRRRHQLLDRRRQRRVRRRRARVPQRRRGRRVRRRVGRQRRPGRGHRRQRRCRG